MQHNAAIIHGMVKPGTSIDDAIKQRHRGAHGNPLPYRQSQPALGRGVKKKFVATARIIDRDHHRSRSLFVMRNIGNMRHQPFIQDPVHNRLIIMRPCRCPPCPKRFPRPVMLRHRATSWAAAQVHHRNSGRSDPCLPSNGDKKYTQSCKYARIRPSASALRIFRSFLSFPTWLAPSNTINWPHLLKQMDPL